MSKKTSTVRTYRLYTYDEVWEEYKTKLNLSDEEMKEEVEAELQMWAWSDIITEGFGARIEMGLKENPCSEHNRNTEQKVI
jgi:hypothetical protein